MTNNRDYPDDYFAESRMSIGDHIEELRTHLFRAIYGLLICLVLGFILDGIGTATGLPIGLGAPMLKIIKAPAEEQMKEFYARRTQKVVDRLKNDLDQDPKLRMPETVDVFVSSESLNKFVDIRPDTPEMIPLRLQFVAAELYVAARKGEINAEQTRGMTVLSVQEGFVVYFKVSLLCGVVLSSPWIFYQVWSFIAAGLYGHEKKYVYTYLPFSLGLFLGGVALCQLVVLPKAVGALLAFNEWLGLDPDLRLNEWLGFAIILPLVFGVSFQTPLVMMFLTKLGIFTSKDYLAKWKPAVMVLAVFSALITPTPDAISMMFLFGPMFALYLIGILLCSYIDPEPINDEEAEEEYGV